MTWRKANGAALFFCFFSLPEISASAVRRGRRHLSAASTELITSKKVAPRLISAHQRRACFISLHLQDKSLPHRHTKARNEQAGSLLVKPDATPFPPPLPRQPTPPTRDRHGGKYSYAEVGATCLTLSLPGDAGLRCTTHRSGKCFSRLASVHLAFPLKGAETQMKEKNDISSSASQPSTNRAYSLFSAGTERSSALQHRIIYLHFLCPSGLTSSSAFPYPLLGKHKTSLGAFLAGVIQIRLQPEWKTLPVAGREAESYKLFANK